MSFMKSSNPALSGNRFKGYDVSGDSGVMTLDGTVNKTGILLLLALGGALYSWTHFNPIFMGAGFLFGFIFALVTMFKKEWAGTTAPLYAISEGLALGGISLMYNNIYEGIAMKAVMLTFGVFFALLAAYKSGMIKATENFKLGVAAATGGIAIVYMVSMVMGMFGARLEFMYGSSLTSIGISLFVVVIAALNLVMDFDFIENAVDAGVPKYMEWYGAFGLILTLVWLYLEILHLLAKLQGRD